MNFLLIIGGLVLLIFGGNWLLKSAVSLSLKLKISKVVVGMTVVSFATSAPELIVSINAALNNSSDLALGNAVGSNITNIALVLGVGIAVSPLLICSNTVKREMPILLLVSLFVLWLMWDGSLTRLDGFILLAAMFVMTIWMAWLGLRESKNKDKLKEEFEAEMPHGVSKKAAWLWLLFGICMLPIASILMVKGASSIAYMLGMTEVMVGLTIVALGTSLPELSATIACMRKSEHDLALGNIVGSNMFNLLGVLGISASIKSFELPENFLSTDYLVMLDLTFALLIFSLIFIDFKID